MKNRKIQFCRVLLEDFEKPTLVNTCYPEMSFCGVCGPEKVKKGPKWVYMVKKNQFSKKNSGNVSGHLEKYPGW